MKPFIIQKKTPMQALKKTTAEIRVIIRVLGATRQIQRQDGRLVTHAWILLMMKLKILAETVKIMVFVKMEMRGFNATALWDFMESIAKMIQHHRRIATQH